MEEDQEIVREFLVESYENLSRLDQDMVELETHPQDEALLASIFRTMHTIKGTCGFLGFATLEKIAHRAESLLSLLRDERIELNPSLVSLILETVDATRRVLASIEADGQEGSDTFDDLIARLEAAARVDATPAKPAQAAKAKPADDAPAKPAIDAREKTADGPAITPVSDKTVPPQKEVPTPPRAKSGQPGDDAQKTSSVADANIRVGVVLLDKLMDLVGELVLARNQILQFSAEREDSTLNATSQRLNLLTTELQESVMKTRMQPIGMVWNKLPRMVRDLAVGLNKQIRLDLDGAETELDRTIIEAIKDPLVHLVRNSCDHGIELPEDRQRSGKPAQGVLSLRAYHEGGQVNIEIADDGAGIDVARVKQKAIEKGILAPGAAQKMSDREALNLIFAPGFSTAQEVTNLSGRGVGMDVVKTHIEKIGGIVDLSSRPGEGTTVKLKIPLTLAIIPGLVVSSGEERFVIPQVSLLELVRIEGDSAKHIEYVHGTPVYRRRGTLLPIAYLNDVLGLGGEKHGDAINIVVLQAEDRQFGLVVDGINDTQEIVVKPLGKQLKGLTVYAGATIMGDGRVALILDVLGIGERSGVLAESREQAHGTVEKKTQNGSDRQRLLLFRAGTFERIAVPLSLVARLEEFPAASIERAEGASVVQYRGRILPLVQLESLLEPGGSSAIADPAQVIVFSDGERSLGVVVDRILDIAEEEVAIRQRASRKGFLGSAVVGKRVADFLDLDYVLRVSSVDWTHDGEGGSKSVLVAAPSAFTRAMLRNRLEMAGRVVIEAKDIDETLRRLEERTVDAVLAADELSQDGVAGLKSRMKEHAEWSSVAVVEFEGDGVEAAAQLNAGLMAAGSSEHTAVEEEALATA